MWKIWTKEVLHELIRSKLQGYRFFVVSNREPYSHRYKNGKIECIQPASGMATALDPVMRACGGVWVAHGSGDADRAVVDRYNRIQVPPGNPEYTLRRVWLTQEQEDGYYNGLANEGLWPLCHVAFTRPLFEPRDWATYREVNQLFADTILQEAGNEPTFVFIQDYHFALLPGMLRAANSNLIIAQFWHIPWPNREIFEAFPWHEEILEGLLGNDLLGFHLRNHCQNFLETVDRGLEAKVDQAGFEITRGGRTTLVRPFPISIDYDEHVAIAETPEVECEMKHWRRELHLKGKKVAIGIDRIDYTKGIPDRLRAFDLLLEKNPHYREQVVFVQIGVPSRVGLRAYQLIHEELDALVEEINQKWGSPTWKPIIFLKKHFSPTQMIALHRLADFCVVTALHDGMNLVAKEFVASRIDEDGALVLSKFTGAARELRDAILVNPFSIEECAEGYRLALEMPVEERKRRMTKMRDEVEQNNIYRWAGKFLSALVKLEFPETVIGAAG